MKTAISYALVTIIGICIAMTIATYAGRVIQDSFSTITTALQGR